MKHYIHPEFIFFTLLLLLWGVFLWRKVLFSRWFKFSGKPANYKSGIYFYVIENEAFKGFVKIGIGKDIENRFNQYHTYAPPSYPFKLYFSHKSPYARDVETEIKDLYKDERKGREWVPLTAEQAKNLYLELLEKRSKR